MGYVLKLKKGTQYLDLSSGNYAVDQWVPPRANIISNVAHGTSANRYGGGVKVSERAVNTSTVFSVRIIAQSNAEVEYLARNIEDFLRQAGDEAEPMYLEWRPDNILTGEPYWGQLGTHRRYEVVSGQVDRWNAYFVTELRSQAMYVNVMLELKPFALGKRQKLMTAKGGIWENTLGLTTGESRGVNLSYDGGNLCTNPIFGNSTFDTGWGASASLTHTENKDPEYVLFGDTSVLMVTTADDQYLAMGIGMTSGATYTVSCYIKMRDRSTPTSDQIEVRIIGGGTPTFRELGNGWWIAYDSYAATADDTFSCGLQINSDVDVYFGGMQVEIRSFPSPMIYGDMLGCSWAGTSHASTSSRSDPMLRMATADLMYKNHFTIRMVWVPDYSDQYGTACYFFDSTGAGELQAYIQSGTVTFNVGSVSLATSSAMDFSVGDVIVMHFVAEAGRVQIYWNGELVASTGSYDVPFPSTYIYVGSDDSLANPINGTILGFTTFDWGFSATEVDDDYDNVYQSATSFSGVGRRVDAIPYLWTKDGDDVVDNSDSSSYDNWAIIGGLSGNVECDPEITVADGNSYEVYYLSRLDMPYNDYYSPGSLTYNGSPDTVSIGTSAVSIGSVALFFSPIAKSLLGKGVAAIVRGRVPTTDNISLLTYSLISGVGFSSDYATSSFVIHASNTSIETSPTITLIDIPEQAKDYTSSTTVSVYVYGKRASGTENFYLTSIQLIPRPFVRIQNDTSSPSSYDGFYYLDGVSYARVAGGGFLLRKLYNTGDRITLVPGKYNALILNIGEEGAASTVTHNATLTVYYKPRWSLV